MNKEEIISSAKNHGIEVIETTFGIFNPEPCFSIQPLNAKAYEYRDGMYHVTCNRSRSELVSGIRLMAERMKIELKNFPSK